MPKISVFVTVKRNREDVYSVVKNVERFPQFMRDVKSVKVLKRSDGGIVAAWEADIDGAPLNWKEEINFDDENFQARFNLLEGGYKAYSGRWFVEGIHGDTCKLSLEANFDWGIPILERYVGKALETKARRGLLGMVQAIKKEVERS